MITIHPLRAGAVLLGLLAAGVLGACDRTYHARLSVAVPDSGSQTAESVASALLSDLTPRFALRCRAPETWVSPDGAETTEPSLVRRACSERKHYTRIVVITSGNTIRVDINNIGGSNEPETFRALRLAAQRHLQQALPGATIAVEFPYET